MKKRKKKKKRKGKKIRRKIDENAKGEKGEK